MGKRIGELVGGAVLIVLTSPLILVGVIVSLVAYRTWPFFVQDRVGLHGRTFRLVKIRTLAPTTPPSLGKHSLEPHRPGAACRFLRAHHLDELPQLISVVGGSMSLVGPRPEMPALQVEFPPDFAGLRTETRPGLTGLWQISVALPGLISEAPGYDRHYVLHCTTRLDAWILGRTARQLVGRQPIESLAEIPRWTGAAQAAVDQSVEHAVA